ncbi:MAG TPA: DUF1761 domain-containing protein [Flavobacteriales bacterium]|nr:DUF1761 domain-containing protein [Flavobacteriales bacterium]
MDYIIEALKHLNWLAVLTAAVASFALGGLWYSPVLFAKRWMKETGVTQENAKGSNIPLIFGTTFVLQIVSAIGLGIMIGGHDMKHGAFMGLFVGGMWVATAVGTNYLYERKTVMLYLINVGYSVGLLTIQGAILGAWH